jgi:uncharacterized protein
MLTMEHGLQAIALQLTDACNLTCSYCYYAHKKPVAMSRQTIDGAIALYLDNRDESPRDYAVIFFGGEPFLARDNMEYAIEKLDGEMRSRGAFAKPKFSVTTNGTLFDSGAARSVPRPRHLGPAQHGRGARRP